MKLERLQWIQRGEDGDNTDPPYYTCELPDGACLSLERSTQEDKWDVVFLPYRYNDNEIILGSLNAIIPRDEALHLAQVMLSCFYGAEAGKYEQLADRILEAYGPEGDE